MFESTTYNRTGKHWDGKPKEKLLSKYMGGYQQKLISIKASYGSFAMHKALGFTHCI